MCCAALISKNIRKEKDMKKINKYFCFLLCTICIFCNINITQAKTVNASLGSRSYIQLTTSSVADRTKPIKQSQAEHKKGVETTLCISKSVTKELQASASIAAEYETAGLKLSGSLGIATSEARTCSTSISYTLKNQKSGLYRIEVVYPCKKQVFNVYQWLNQSNTCVYSKTIKYAPLKGDSYITFNRYASAAN